jgi:hypothetical protein
VITVISNVFTRPIRSASTPATAPPSAESTSVAVLRRPAWPLEMPKNDVIATRLRGRIQ